jgi:hypothetical protein
MPTFAQKQKPIQKANSGSFMKPGQAFSGHSHDISPIHYLQHNIWNQAVPRTLQASAEQLKANQVRGKSSGFAHDFSRIHIYGRSPIQVQPKLTVNTPADPFEHEADRIADQVMRIPETKLQPGCVCGGECPKCRAEQLGRTHGLLQTKHIQANDSLVSLVPPMDHDILRSSGQPLDQATRAYFEPRFGYSFSDVRVHTTDDASTLAESIHARAFTLGRNVAFAASEYQPDTVAGRQLIAHELTHVVQQSIGAQPQRGPVPTISHTPSPSVQRAGDPTKTPKDTDLASPAPEIPQALLIRNESGPDPNDCGGYSWLISWLLAKDSAAGGHIVQHIVVDYSIKNWLGLDITSKIVKPHWNFWEAWRVKAGEGTARMVMPGEGKAETAPKPETEPAGSKGGTSAPSFPVPYSAGSDDFRDADTGRGTSGKIVVTGDAKFYEGLVTLPPDFIYHNPDTQSKVLPSTTTDPNLKGGTPNVDHDITVEWDCDFTKSKTKILSHKP